MTETAAKRFGLWLRGARKAVGISQTDFAELMGVSRGSMSNLERGVPPSENSDPNEPRHITPYLIKSLVRVLRERGSPVTEGEAYEAVGILPAGAPTPALALPGAAFPNPRPHYVSDGLFEPYARTGQVVWLCRAEDLSEEDREDLPAVVAIDGERRIVIYRGRGRDNQGRPAYQLEDTTGTFYIPRDQVQLEEFVVVIGELARQGTG